MAADKELWQNLSCNWTKTRGRWKSTMRLSGLCFRPGKRKRQCLWKWKKRRAVKHQGGWWNMATIRGVSTQLWSRSPLYNGPVLSQSHLIPPFLSLCSFANLDSLQFHEYISFIFCIFSLYFSFAFTLNALVPVNQIPMSLEESKKRELFPLGKLLKSHLPTSSALSLKSVVGYLRSWFSLLAPLSFNLTDSICLDFLRSVFLLPYLVLSQLKVYSCLLESNRLESDLDCSTYWFRYLE